MKNITNKLSKGKKHLASVFLISIGMLTIQSVSAQFNPTPHGNLAPNTIHENVGVGVLENGATAEIKQNLHIRHNDGVSLPWPPPPWEQTVAGIRLEVTDPLNGDFSWDLANAGKTFHIRNVNDESSPFVITHQNKIGVGIQNPLTKFHVHEGIIRLTGDNFAGGPMITFGGPASGWVGANGRNGAWGIEYVSTSHSSKPGLNFWRPNPNVNSGNHFLFLADNGKVAIGTDETPSNYNGANLTDYRLYVKGGLLSDEIRVMTGWADYVFDSDYVLKPLSEVEKFIEANGHLPNVPTAEEVESQGIELGDITRIQQEKIEELTLYQIELEKQVSILQAQMQELLFNLNSK